MKQFIRLALLIVLFPLAHAEPSEQRQAEGVLV